MAISLQKGGNISLNKEDPGLKKVLIGLGWDIRATQGSSFDLDASLFMLGSNGKARNGKDFIFFNNLKSGDGSVEHAGDNLTGEGDGDDEVIKANLEQIPSNVDKLVVCVTIHDAEKRRQNFGMIASAYVRILNQETTREIVRFDLSEDMGTETDMIFGEIYRHSGEWKFRAIGQGFSGGLGSMAISYGIQLG